MNKIFHTISFIYAVLLAITTCSCQSNESGDLRNILSSDKRMLCVETQENYIKGDLVLYDLNNNLKVKLKTDFLAETNPRMTTDGKYLLHFYSSVPPHKPKFVITNLSDNQKRMVDLSKRLPPSKDITDNLLTFETYSDSEIVFNYQQDLYNYNFITDSLKVFKNLNKYLTVINNLTGAKVSEIALCKRCGKMALLFFGSARIVIWDYLRDSVKYLEPLAFGMSNWSPDGSRIFFRSQDAKDQIYKEYVYEAKEDKYYPTEDIRDEYYTSNEIEEERKHFEPYQFISDEIILIQQNGINGNLFLYDLKSKKIIKQVTNDGLDRQGCDLTIYTK